MNTPIAWPGIIRISEMSYTIGIDIGGSDIKCITVEDADVATIERRSSPTVDALQPDGKPGWYHEVQKIVSLIEEERGASATGIGISAPGIGAPDESCIALMINRMEHLTRLNWSEALHRPEGVPVLNDAQAALLGEHWRGAARGMRNVFMLTLGTGVGGAAMVDGRMLKGHRGRAGHLGHISIDYLGAPDICRTPGSLEDAIGNDTLAERSDGRFKDTHDLVEALVAGDEVAEEIWGRAIRALAAGVASLVNVLDPEAVVIGGGISKAGDALFHPLAAELAKCEWRPFGQAVPLVPAELGTWAGACGAAFNVMSRA